MKRIICFLFIFFLLVSKFSQQTYAASPSFATSFDVTYTVLEDGMTHVTFLGSIQNISEKYYATSYTLKLAFDDIEHIQVSDSKGPIVPQLTKIDSVQSLYIPFNAHIITPKKSATFTVSFDTTTIAHKTGSIWEINIPGLAKQSDFKDFSVHLHVPSSFGKPTYIKPAQQGSALDFSKQSLGNSGISVAFGDIQVYNFALTYHLKNDNLFPITTEIALPPSTNYQDVVLNDINPKPLNISLDPDGNWLAKYSLSPSQKILITAKGSSFVSLRPKHEVLTDEQKKIYVEEQQYWQVNTDIIKKLAKELKTPQNIFDYVVQNLSYNFARVSGKQERLGAQFVLSNPSSAVCLEFTDLFITIARAAGIPAREIDGFAYTQNKLQRPLSLVKDVLHAWPEYYDKDRQAWIMVDPTWENTTKGTDYFHTLDFDHFAFIIRGQSSTYPLPPGDYKLSPDDKSKDVYVRFGSIEKLEAPQITVAFDISPILFSGFPVTGNIIFKNISQRLVTPQRVDIAATSLFPHTQTLTADAIPPFGYVQLPVNFRNTSLLTNEKENITIKVAGNTISKTISIEPIFSQHPIEFSIGTIVSILTLLIIFYIVFIYKKKK